MDFRLCTACNTYHQGDIKAEPGYLHHPAAGHPSSIEQTLFRHCGCICRFVRVV